MEIREKSDAGMPVVVSAPDGELAQIYKEIAGRTWDRLVEERAMSGAQAPKIVIES